MDPIQTAILREGETEITVLSMGCAIQDWQVGGQRVVLGYADPEAYRSNPKSMGIVVGRVANRTAGARFELDGKTWSLPANSGKNHIHGGPGGLGRCNWDMVQDSDTAVNLSLTSPHLDQGYPGTVRFDLRLSLSDGAFTWDMRAVPDRVTPVNLAQHLYFNLCGSGSVRDHVMQIAASRYTPTNAELVPTGEILQVEGSRFDFRRPRRIDEADPDMLGYDLNFALDEAAGTAPQARVQTNGLTLELATDQPGLQVYTSNMLSEAAKPHSGQHHGRFGGLCLEAQAFPNALNQPGFGSVLCSPDAPYRQLTTVRIRHD